MDYKQKQDRGRSQKIREIDFPFGRRAKPS